MVHPVKRIKFDSKNLKSEVVEQKNNTLINQLNCSSVQWIILGLVFFKGLLRKFNNDKNKVFSFDICDQSGEIRVTCFNDEAERWFDFIKEEQIYSIFGGIIKRTNPKFKRLKNDFEIHTSIFTNIQKVNKKIPSLTNLKNELNFKTIEEILQLSNKMTCALIAIVHSATDIQTIFKKGSSKQLTKRDLLLIDKTKKSINLTLWETDSEKFVFEENMTVFGNLNKIIILKNIKFFFKFIIYFDKIKVIAFCCLNTMGKILQTLAISSLILQWTKLNNFKNGILQTKII